MQRAYNVAASGNVIEVRAGNYPAQTVPGGSKAVTFRGVPGNKSASSSTTPTTSRSTGSTSTRAARKTTGAVFETGGDVNITFKNGRIGNVVDEKGAMIGGQASPAPLNLVFDNVDFHDVVQRSSDVHNECIVRPWLPGLTIRNSTFRNCATMDLFVKRGDWWGQPAVRQHHAREQRLRALHQRLGLALLRARTGPTTRGRRTRVVNNTFENAVDASATSATARTRACGPTTSAAAGSACPA